MNTRFLIAASALAAVAASGAHAQGTLFGSQDTRGTWGAAKSSSAATPARPPSATTPYRPPTPATPPAGGFKPYEPYKGASVYTAPKPATPGAKPCETSVYVNACDKQR